MHANTDIGLTVRFADLPPPPPHPPPDQPRRIESAQRQDPGRRAALDDDHPRSPVVQVVRRSAEQFEEMVQAALSEKSEQREAAEAGRLVDRYA
ncbi:MAG: hypothetical protein LC135_15545 [Phycisphaerae bacterium]|jgi:hypothetical protein|nr:hypothetical protein [Phycisphaerae bacterium]MCZ2401255.1 hypothetical protein [Phycisphaerae bacterium]NUQ49928.1 hypothetical protein [Phycisphaerae bacterium]